MSGRTPRRRCSDRRSRTPGHRSCTWRPTARSGLTDWTYERIECTADRIARAGGRFRPRVGGLVGDHAGQVRRAAVRRRTHGPRRTRRLGQHAASAPTPAGAPTTPTSTASRARSAQALSDQAAPTGRAAVYGSGAPPPPPSSGSSSSASSTSRSPPATRSKVAPLLDLGAQPRRRGADGSSSARRWPTSTSWSARSRPTSAARVRRHPGGCAGAARRDLRPVADAAGRRGRSRGRDG